MKLRAYQIDAIDATFEAWKSAQAVLGVAATGLGKTIMFASIIARHPGRTMVVAHREELIFQAADKIHRVTGMEPKIEMAEIRVDEYLGLLEKPRCVISTIQTQVAGNNGGRMKRFDPHEFDLLVVDEGHHSTATSYRKVIDHYRQNPNLRVLGVTATPDRADEEALGQIFDAVAFECDLRFGITDGWLVPIVQRTVKVDGLDLSNVRTTAGDLNGGDLARIMEYERNLHEVAAPTIELVGDRKALIFAASLAHAERLCEILNRHKKGCAKWVSGETPKEVRRLMFKAYAEKQFQYLVNVGVATEGFDDPGIEAVVMARPTKSRALYTQMIGRGTRPLPGIVDDPDMFGSASMRCEAIEESTKKNVEIFDFVGNSGKHKLITTTDILGGHYSDAVVERARKKQGDTLKALEDASREIHEEREEQKRIEAARRSKLVVQASYKTSTTDPFDVFGLEPWREKAWDHDKPISEKMAKLLKSQGITEKMLAQLTFTQGRQLISEITGRWDRGECSYKQACILAKHGYDTNCSREDASKIIDGIAATGWKSRAPAYAESRY